MCSRAQAAKHMREVLKMNSEDINKEYVQPVKRGWWKQIGEQSAKCTACGGVLKSNGIDKTGKALIFNAVYHYCPNCGAIMDGDDENES